MRAVFLDFGSVTRGDMDCTALERVISPWRYYDETSTEQVAERIREAEVIVCNKLSLDRAAIVSAKNLKLICVAATGYNNIDLTMAAERKIPVCNVRTYATPSVVQHVFMLMLNLSRHFIEYQQLVGNGRWSASAHFQATPASTARPRVRTRRVRGALKRSRPRPRAPAPLRRRGRGGSSPARP